MFRNRVAYLVLAVFISTLLVVSCSKKSSDEADGTEEVSMEETIVQGGTQVVGDPSSTANTSPPSQPSNIEGTPEALKAVEDAKKKDADYKGEVVLKITEGGIQYNAIKSKSKCTTAKDCTNTKYANVPKIDRDCTCAAACTPFVVNYSEKKLREAANKKLCDQNDWYGATCPAPPCNFMGFDFYRCIDNVCFGMAAGRN